MQQNPEGRPVRLTNRDRIRVALDALREGLVPFVERKLLQRIGPQWADRLDHGWRFPLDRNPDGGVRWDTSALLRAMTDNWRTAFQDSLGHPGRAWVSELIETRNDHAHEKPFDNDRTLRSLDSARLLLTKIGATPQAAAVDELRQEKMRAMFRPTALSPAKQRSTMVGAKTPPVPGPASNPAPAPRLFDGRYSFTLLGETNFCRTRRDVLIGVFSKLADMDPGFLERAAPRLVGTKRSYLSRDRAAIGETPRYAPVQLSGGWWLRTGFMRENMLRRLQTAAEVAGLVWNRDLIVNLG